MECLVGMNYKKLGVQITLNYRPLTHLEDGPRLPVLTPRPMLFMNCNVVPELQPDYIETTDLHKRASHLLQYKELLKGVTCAVFARNILPTQLFREKHLPSST